jgi:hypothetical protein
MCKYIFLFTFVGLVSSCGFKIPAGTYTTAAPFESGGVWLAGTDFTFTQNGRFQYRFWTDDGPPDIGHGGFIIIGNNILFLFENAQTNNSAYVLNEIECTKQDSQVVNFKITDKTGYPLIAVSIYNTEDHQGTITKLDGIGQITLLKEPKNRTIQLHYLGYEDLAIKFNGNKCFDIDIILRENIDHLKRGDVKVAKLKREGDQLFIKLHTWRDYSKIFKKSNI